MAFCLNSVDRAGIACLGLCFRRRLRENCRFYCMSLLRIMSEPAAPPSVRATRGLAFSDSIFVVDEVTWRLHILSAAERLAKGSEHGIPLPVGAGWRAPGSCPAPPHRNRARYSLFFLAKSRAHAARIQLAGQPRGDGPGW